MTASEARSLPTEVLDAIASKQLPEKADWYGYDLSNLDLQQVNFKGAILIRANLASTQLQNADLSATDLRGAYLRNANLQGASLKDAVLTRADLCGVDLRDADLEGASLQWARYDSRTQFPENFNFRSSGAIGPKAYLNGATLNTANLRYADLSGASLLGAYLGGADLTGASLEGARLSQADLRRSIMTGASLRDARINAANISGVDLRAVDMTNVDFETLEDISGADFSLVRGLKPEQITALLSRPETELQTRHAITRTSTQASLKSLAEASET